MHGHHTPPTEDPSPMSEYYLVRFFDVRPRTEWNENERRIFDAHVAYLRHLEAEGSLRYAGLAKDPASGELAFGYALYAAENQGEGETLVHDDPGVRDGILTAEWVRMERFFGAAP